MIESFKPHAKAQRRQELCIFKLFFLAALREQYRDRLAVMGNRLGGILMVV